MFAAKDRADDVRGQYGEPEQPRRVRRNDAFGFGNILEGAASVCEELVPDRIGTDEQTHKAGVRSCGLRPITHDDPHLLAGAPETRRNAQGRRLEITLGLRFVDQFVCSGTVIKAPTDPILIQDDINTIYMDLDADDA